MGQVGAKLRPNWGQVGPSWAKLGQVRAKLGPSWAKLGQVGPSWGQVAAKLRPSWGQVGLQDATALLAHISFKWTSSGQPDALQDAGELQLEMAGRTAR